MLESTGILAVDVMMENERRINSFIALCRIEVENLQNYQKCEIARSIAGRELREVRR